MSFTQLMQSIAPAGDKQWSVTITDSWMQGRTTYGGLSAALCLQAVLNDYPDLPPLRSAQLNFVGPSGGAVTITSKVLRRGKSVAYISAEMTSDTGVATDAVFCFGASRDSRLNRDFTTPPNVPGIKDSTDFLEPGLSPIFTQHFDCRLAKGGLPVSGTEESDLFVWSRHKDQSANDMVALIGLADIPPPAVLPMFKEFAPISSMTWMMNFLTDAPQTQDGWWLFNSSAEHARNGYSSQNMHVWNRDLELVATGRQNVAIFY